MLYECVCVWVWVPTEIVPDLGMVQAGDRFVCVYVFFFGGQIAFSPLLFCCCHSLLLALLRMQTIRIHRSEYDNVCSSDGHTIARIHVRLSACGKFAAPWLVAHASARKTNDGAEEGRGGGG